ncbi:MAG: FHA domain-containing protein [Acidobacteriota bacterium]
MSHPANNGGDLAAAQIEIINTVGPAASFKLQNDSLWLGRDPGCGIVFDPSVSVVSRRHAEIRQTGSALSISDNKSFNGTYVNGVRISGETGIAHNDEIQLGEGGPRLRVNAPAFKNGDEPRSAEDHSARTVVANQLPPQTQGKSRPNLLRSVDLGTKTELTIGRDAANDIVFADPKISNRHAKLSKTNLGFYIEDLGSTNGTYVNGDRAAGQVLAANDAVQIGPFIIKVDASGHVDVFDSRASTRIDAVQITKEVKDRSGSGSIRLLDDVSLSIQPNEFVGLLGPSGAGKSTLMDAMNGMRPASSGAILVNNLNLYEHLDLLKQSIGYVPQDDIIHRELSVYRTLFYVAKLRLPADVLTAEIEKIIAEVLDTTGLSERGDVPINQLSGGQRKRVSIAVELLTKPSVIFLDEPTSGLDPATEEKIMKLFREIAESGRTIILTTHAMENVKLFDKIVVMMRGKLVFYGAPDEALRHFGAASYKELYDKLEEPAEAKVKSGASRQHAMEEVAEDWKKKFAATKQYQKNVYEPLVGIQRPAEKEKASKKRLGISASIRQWSLLSRRYWEVLSRDKLNLLILFAQAPIIAALTYIVIGENQPRDFAFFILSLVAVWFGTSVAAREIVRERPVYDRERMVNVGIAPYLFSKLFVLGIIVGIQCLLLFLPLKLMDMAGVMPMPGELYGIPQFWVMFATALVGVAIGLLISAVVKTSELATSLVPLILIPQILFSGLLGVPTGVNRAVGLLMPAAWAYDSMKRYSALDTLEEEGADPNSNIGGRGYYKYIETQNNKIIADAKRQIEEYKTDAETKIDDFEADLKAGKSPAKPQLDEPPKPADAVRLEKKAMGNMVSFLNPWMDKSLNQAVLIAMLVVFLIATVLVLRIREVN